MEEILCSELETMLNNKNIAFLCGNGFSINFDKSFGNICDRLHIAHKTLIKNCKFKINANKLFKGIYNDNYKSVLTYVRNYNENNFDSLFLDGISFAESIIDNKVLIEKMMESGGIHELVFGKSELDLIASIVDVGKIKGYKNVNIEYWTVLIYIYYLITIINCDEYTLPKGNEFITLIRLGDVNTNKLFPQPISEVQYTTMRTLSNGFNTYYRMLFCIAILDNGKALNLDNLENIHNIDCDKLKNFLNRFAVQMTLNYDHILEEICKKDIIHMHGEYVKNKEEFVYYQSLGVQMDESTYVSFSDILLGDYFVNKTYALVTYAGNDNPMNKKVKNTSDIMRRVINDYGIDSFFIFGMNIDNDQHILRNMMLELQEKELVKPSIIYCYFTEYDRENFEQQYNRCITFRNDVSERVKNIEVKFIKTQDILTKYFK